MQMPERYGSVAHYRMGFNGYEKDDEIYGKGNSIDFTARFYDSRLARFKSLDPLFRQFPSESNFIYGGNNPVLFIDKDGEKKITYHVIVNLRDNSITIPTDRSISDGLISQHRTFYNSIKEYWEFFDYSVIQTTVIDESGKKTIYESSPFNVDYTKPKSWAIVPLEWAGRVAAEESAFDWSASVKESAGKTFNGINFTSNSGVVGAGRDNKYNKSGNGPTINIDDLLAVLAVGGPAFSTGQIKDFETLVRYVNDATQVMENARTLAPITVDNSLPKKYDKCSSCGEIAEKGVIFKDTLGNGNSNNTNLKDPKRFHNDNKRK